LAVVPLELYTATHVMIGTLELGQRRLSDHLNDTGADVIPLGEAWIGDLAHGSVLMRLAPANFRKHDLVAVAAQDRLDPGRTGYVKTTTMRVAASAGPFFLTGDVHLAVGSGFDIRRLFGPGSRPFVPLTNATMRYTPKPKLDVPHTVLLVRTDHVEFAGIVEGSPPTLPFLARAIEDRLRELTRGSGRNDEGTE
jgi:hypothetical protein